MNLLTGGLVAAGAPTTQSESTQYDAHFLFFFQSQLDDILTLNEGQRAVLKAFLSVGKHVQLATRCYDCCSVAKTTARNLKVGRAVQSPFLRKRGKNVSL